MLKWSFWLAAWIGFAATGLQAQGDEAAKQQVIDATDLNRLLDFSTQKRVAFQEQKAAAIRKAADRHWPLTVETEDGLFMELMGLDEHGGPVYFKTDNRNAGRTTRANRVHNNGGAGFNLEGQNMSIYVWDGGTVLSTHQEFGSRITVMDGGSANFHATHVGGTMVAAGVSASAKGMAPQARLYSYDWNSDDSEMSNRAAAGMLVSNHSYGTTSGWLQNGTRWEWYGLEPATRDYKFGYYDSRARDWDYMSFYAPYYLIVKSAGNDRGDYSASGTYYYCGGGSGCVSRTNSGSSRPEKDGGTAGYDCISTYGNAKNILTVGAVEDVTTYSGPSSVVMSSFSGWGPTDDGRIKPDLVGNGVQLYSAYVPNNNSYANSSGTSMASPNVSGSLLLLQQHHKAVKGGYMRSASLKALAVHTTDEAGQAPGPDYIFGWGLLNIERAAQLISDNSQFIQERTLSNTGVYEKSYKASGAPIRITICWTDPETNPLQSNVLDNPAVRLVNDLDIRLVDELNNVSSPYILNPFSPSSAAATGDNFRDNVEQIYLFSPVAGRRYRIRVSHKGNLVRGPQAYSLIITGLQDVPEVTFSASKKVICKGQSVVFTNTTSGGVIHTWQFQGGSITSGSSTSHSVTYSNVGKYTVSLTMNFQGLLETRVDTITVLDYPTAQIVDPGIVCKPHTGFYNILSLQPGGVWNGQPWMTRTDSAVFIPNVMADGNYPLIYSITNAGGCSASDTLSVKIRRKPNVSFLLLPSRVCNTSRDFELNSGSPSGGIYTWAGVPISSFSPSLTGPGTYEIVYTYTDINGCEVAVSQYLTVDNCVGMGEYGIDAPSPYLVPNPATGRVSVVWPRVKVVSLRLYNLAGEQLPCPVIDAQHFDLSHLSRGFYLVEAQGANGETHRLKLVVQ